jgi:hypothetical protein
MPEIAASSDAPGKLSPLRDRRAARVRRTMRDAAGLLLVMALLLQTGCGVIPNPFTTVSPDAAAKTWVREAAHWIGTGEAGQLWAHTCTQERRRTDQVAAVTDTAMKLASDAGQDDLAWLIALVLKLRPHIDVDELEYRLMTENPAQAENAVAIVDIHGQIRVTLLISATIPVNHLPIRMRYEERAWRFCGVASPVGLPGLPPNVPAPIPSGR